MLCQTGVQWAGYEEHLTVVEKYKSTILHYRKNVRLEINRMTRAVRCGGYLSGIESTLSRDHCKEVSDRCVQKCWMADFKKERQSD